MASKDDSLYGKLVDAFQEQRDAERHKLSDVVLPDAPIASWRVICGEHVPPATLYVSRDVWDALKRACDERNEYRGPR